MSSKISCNITKTKDPLNHQTLNYTKKSFSFLVNGTTLPSDNPFFLNILGRTYYKMTVSEKIKTIDNKIGQDKAQYYLN